MFVMEEEEISRSSIHTLALYENVGKLHAIIPAGNINVAWIPFCFQLSLIPILVM